MSNDRTPRPESEGPGGASTIRVTVPGDIDRARRRWWHDRQRNRRRVSYALDAHLDRMYGLTDPLVITGDNQPDSDDYWRDCGMTLGVEERERAA